MIHPHEAKQVRMDECLFCRADNNAKCRDKACLVSTKQHNKHTQISCIRYLVSSILNYQSHTIINKKNRKNNLNVYSLNKIIK